MKKQIPNLITLGNLLCGVLASFEAVRNDIWSAAFFICLGIVFDFFDGFAARLLKVSSEIGKELDSLADLVTSGIAPAFILFNATEKGLDAIAWQGEFIPEFIRLYLPFIAFLMPLFAAYRLAKFNLDPEQAHSFKGLPAPANALIWVGLAFSLPDFNINICLDSISNDCHPAYYETWKSWWTYSTVALSLLTNILMISRIPMFSLKVNLKDLSWRSNATRYLFLAGCGIIVVIGRQWYCISLIILWYILLSVIRPEKHNDE